MRVLLTTIPIGATTPVHTHRLPSVEYVLAATNFVRSDAHGKVVLDTRTTDAEPRVSDILWSDPFEAYSLEGRLRHRAPRDHGGSQTALPEGLERGMVNQASTRLRGGLMTAARQMHRRCTARHIHDAACPDPS